MLSNLSFNDVISFSVDDTDYSCEVNANATEYYTPGRMYMPNGDPGYPPEYEFEISDFELLTLFNEDTETDIFKKYTQDKEFKKKIDDEVYSYLENAYEDGKWEVTNDCE